MRHHFTVLFENIPDNTLRGRKSFAVKNIQVIAEREIVNRVAVCTMRVLYNHHLFTKPGFKVGELNQHSYAPSQDRYRWKEIIMWIHESTLTTKSEKSTC
jgi:hypothetical protein